VRYFLKFVTFFISWTWNCKFMRCSCARAVQSWFHAEMRSADQTAHVEFVDTTTTNNPQHSSKCPSNSKKTNRRSWSSNSWNSNRSKILTTALYSGINAKRSGVLKADRFWKMSLVTKDEFASLGLSPWIINQLNAAGEPSHSKCLLTLSLRHKTLNLLPNYLGLTLQSLFRPQKLWKCYTYFWIRRSQCCVISEQNWFFRCSSSNSHSEGLHSRGFRWKRRPGSGSNWKWKNSSLCTSHSSGKSS